MNIDELIRIQANDTSGLQLLNVDNLIDMAETFAAGESFNYGATADSYPVCVARHEQIFNLLRQEKYINRDFTSQIPLIRGEFNLYMGFQFVRTAAIDAFPIPSTYVKGPALGAITGTDVVSAAAAGYTELTFSKYSRVLFCRPMMAFCKGIYPQAGYMNVWQNPARSGTIEYYMKNVMAWKRKQNEYVRVLYCNTRTDAAAAPIRQKGIGVGGTSVNQAYYTNNLSGAAGWDYDQALAAA